MAKQSHQQSYNPLHPPPPPPPHTHASHAGSSSILTSWQQFIMTATDSTLIVYYQLHFINVAAEVFCSVEGSTTIVCNNVAQNSSYPRYIPVLTSIIPCACVSSLCGCVYICLHMCVRACVCVCVCVCVCLRAYLRA